MLLGNGWQSKDGDRRSREKDKRLVGELVERVVVLELLDDESEQRVCRRGGERVQQRRSNALVDGVPARRRVSVLVHTPCPPPHSLKKVDEDEGQNVDE